MKRNMKRYGIWCGILLVWLAALSGCVQLGQYRFEDDEVRDPVIVFRSFSSYYILSCLQDSRDMDRQEFGRRFAMAESAIEQGADLDSLRFVCLSLNAQADVDQFRRGLEEYNRYLRDHPDAGNDMLGLRILLERLDEEIRNSWSARETLLDEKKQLQDRLDLLQGSLEQVELKNIELQNQIEQLKNIEQIIKSRETDKP
ncbi:MAG TPA: hypothetical protein ENN06_09830 [Desulfobacteraceae bacterium]|nr:hypothetical protein [Desulfobacteraceae bacterium]